MHKRTYLVTNEQGQFYTESVQNPWTPDESLALKYVNPEEAKAIAERENAFVVPAL